MPVSSPAKPSGCPSSAAIQSSLNGLQAFVRSQGSGVAGFVTGSNETSANLIGASIDRLNAITRCMSSAQLNQFLRITEISRNRARAQERTANATTNPLVDISRFLGSLSNPVTWVRVGEFVGGTVLVLMGIKALAAQQGISIPTGRL